MINLPYNTCFGCYGCYNSCPRNAISMHPDKYGYEHPVIDTDKCIECHLCEKACTEINPLPLKAPFEILAAAPKSKEEADSVASGGLCTEASRHFIENGGIVYGCEEVTVSAIHHTKITKESDLDRIKKSKYVHSSIEHTFREIKFELDSGAKILFIGTPCQVSGLYGYLRKKYDNLYTIDLVCHGVPSQQMLIDQIKLMNLPQDFETNGRVEFRWKTSKGIRFGMKYIINKQTIKEQLEADNAYMAAFTIGISYRENCYSCPFARQERIGDLTAADFWGLGEEVKSDFRDIDGVSLVLINSSKGKILFDSIKHKFDTENHTIEEAKLNNLNLRQPAPRPLKRNKFLEIYLNKGLKKAAIQCVPGFRKRSHPLYKLYCKIPGLPQTYKIIKRLLFKNNEKER
ncbi:MAG: 4Fe-4S dicluster domain-containing protein [Bacteroides sp.]|nr:4Fe-4S dicluster domain-containing protein [Bacteroides sp.]